MVVTILLLGGASLAIEYALLDVKKRASQREDREEGRILYVDSDVERPDSGRREPETGEVEEDPTGLVASLVEEYPSDRRRVARKLARIGSPSAIEALVALCTGEEDPVQRELIMGSLARSPRGRDGIRRLAEDPLFSGRARAQTIVSGFDESR